MVSTISSAKGGSMRHEWAAWAGATLCLCSDVSLIHRTFGPFFETGHRVDTFQPFSQRRLIGLQQSALVVRIDILPIHTEFFWWASLFKDSMSMNATSHSLICGVRCGR